MSTAGLDVATLRTLAGSWMLKLDVKVVEPLTDDQLRRLIAACQPPAGAAPQVALRHRRDEAIFRLMLETGARAGEVVAMTLADLDLPADTAVIRRGKGGNGRVVPVGPHAAKALDRYPAAAPPPPAWRHLPGAVARRPRQAVLLRRPAQVPGGAGRPPASADSTRTGCGTPPPTAGWAPAAPRPA